MNVVLRRRREEEGGGGEGAPCVTMNHAQPTHDPLVRPSVQ